MPVVMVIDYVPIPALLKDCQVVGNALDVLRSFQAGLITP